MKGDHDRYDELAVGHVLGGLDPVDSAEFRSHLIGCRNCRLRVAELRDLASELAAAEREERAAARVKTEVRDELGDDPEDDERSGGAAGRRFVPLIALGAALVLAAAFWVFQIRDQNSTLLAATERREMTLAMLAEEQQVETELASSVEGIVVRGDEEVAFTVSGVPIVLPDSEVVAIWLLGEEGPLGPPQMLSGPIEAGRLAMHLPHEDAVALVVTVQPFESLDAPAGRQLLRAELRPAAG